MYKQEEIKPYGDGGTKSQQVESMFDNIAHSYDVLNHTLSFGIDKIWRKKAIAFLQKNRKTTDSVLDIATGTGDFAILAYEKLHPSKVVGVDISEGMMNVGREKVKEHGLQDCIQFQKEDCANMSFQNDTFDAVISAFALRNFENLDVCLKEMHRVLADGGHLSVVDLCTPVSFPMKQLFYVYSHIVMPLVGRFISKDTKAYTYLPDTMSAVPQAKKMQNIISKAGFKNTKYKRLLFGMCILYTAEK
ncbi:MAG: bifunctional demethylmenaquinone methyltransferase/2-methoxy-6-polyprenyl-1,4-benzoquinol methylase UbiE [Bacteroidaceae bacterium]|nr:bifunctional demethylmenaquinone methyltransferase/2-methoxy-6-polyprenyl-1,4-benzoquinol methylase UbiE [Bacteroidaceae bacterium]